ncbi:polysaccharide deacetylase family protein [Streptomyces sp. SPB074]|uniref:polysaccharide deacetylase family protein n=1 Tax=Streptomyces sp. (strain SPB074) TaxID=465543 RepID=UPI001F3FFF7C|nr:polysaccharide deacetylase family protein [Streptomyces sp. SPB074]
MKGHQVPSPQASTLPSSFSWPDDRQVAVIATVAVELWSHGSWPVYAPMAAAWPLPGAQDTHSVSWAEYGVTTGVWRLLDILQTKEMRATFGINGLVAERFPEILRATGGAGHEIAAHSYAQDVLPACLDAAAERANIVRSCDLIEGVTGRRPTGWMSPRATGTARTVDLLAQAGLTWSGDFNDADLPYVLHTPYGPVVAIMHSDVSDVRTPSGPAAYRSLLEQLLGCLLASGRPQILNLTVHAHVGGRPAMADAIGRVLDSVQQAGDRVWVATHQQVAEHVLRHTGHATQRQGAS